MSTTLREKERARTQRNINPHREARLAMVMWGAEYARLGIGSMDFWDGLSDSRKRLIRDVLDDLEKTKREDQ